MFDRLRRESGDLLESIEYLPRMVMVMFCLFNGHNGHSLFFVVAKQVNKLFPWPDMRHAYARLNKRMG